MKEVEPDGAVQRPLVKPDDAPPDGEADGAVSDPRADLGPVQGPIYEWRDGDRTRRVWLQVELAAKSGDDGGETIVPRQPEHGESTAQPVFRSASGALMTLPGGVLLVLDPAWDEETIERFFAAHGIVRGRTTEEAFAANGFFVDTAPGLPSLTLANELADAEGVLISSPNWRTEAVTK